MRTTEVSLHWLSKIEYEIVGATMASGETKMEDPPCDQSTAHEEIETIQPGIDDMNAGRVRSLQEIDQEFRAQRNISTDSES